ncbi:hypothetical protein [Nevskia soli]|uniref:hypothetical protein n=1 Tax=Nevskia soli TaxID=418856 RepID=UPI0012F7A093|nr:hypothetical protein [Nevskia soli]
MDSKEAIGVASTFLDGRGIGYCEPIKVFPKGEEGFVVILTVPEALDPNVVVDPPEVRVLVSIIGRKAELLPDM